MFRNTFCRQSTNNTSLFDLASFHFPSVGVQGQTNNFSGVVFKKHKFHICDVEKEFCLGFWKHLVFWSACALREKFVALFRDRDYAGKSLSKPVKFIIIKFFDLIPADFVKNKSI